MSISLRTHKMLWGRSGNICAYPECKKVLVMDISETDDISVIGEEAHIVAREADGPRGDAPLVTEQRDKYGNLILMCSIHHKIIDDHPTIYTVEVLHDYKKRHEDWFREKYEINVSKQKDDELYSAYIDEIMLLLDIEKYKDWTSGLLGTEVRISRKKYEKLRELINYILSRVWPRRYPKLENALINLNYILNDLLIIFDKYSEGDKRSVWTRRFYRIDHYDENLYNKLLDKYNYHNALIKDLTFELTRAINYIFDLVRLYLISSFRLSEGVLLVESGDYVSYTIYRLEYKQDERNIIPYPGLREFMKIRVDRDSSWGDGINEDYFSDLF